MVFNWKYLWPEDNQLLTPSMMPAAAPLGNYQINNYLIDFISKIYSGPQLLQATARKEATRTKEKWSHMTKIFSKITYYI